MATPDVLCPPIAPLLEAGLVFHRMQPEHLLAIDVQDSQATFLGLPAEPDMETAEELAAQPVAWTAWRGEQVLACFGFREAFPGKHGTAWALLGKGIGRDHLALTRFVRGVVEGCTLDRLDVMARAPEVEDYAQAARDHGFWPTTGMLAEAAFDNPTPEMRWCLMLGFERESAHLLRKFGAAGEAYMMFERIR